MANDLSSKIDIFFEEVVIGFDAMNISARNVAQYKPNVGQLAEGGQTFYRPEPLMTTTVDGRDVSAAYKDVAELTVPSTLTDSHLRNVPLSLTGSDLNNPHIMQRMVNAATVKLSNKLDVLVADEVASKGSLVVTSTTNIDTYDEAAVADALMLEQQCTKGQRMMLLNPRMAINLAGNLASRGTMQGAPMDAYTRSMLPPIAGFDTFRTDYGKTIVGAASPTNYIFGASQAHTPVAQSAGLPVDNRTMTLNIDNGAGAAHGLVVGDAFTIAGVYSVGHINKQSTGQLKTFRVLAVPSATSITVAPAIIPADGAAEAQKAYANVDTTPADNAAITRLNIVTKPASVFFEKDAIEIIHADYNLEPFTSTGKKVRTSTTDSGITIVLMSDSDVDTLVAKYRMFIWANVAMLNYEMGGIMLEGQT